MLKRLSLTGLWLAWSCTALAAGENAGETVPDPAAHFDHLWNEMLIDITVIGIVFSLVALYFLVRYRRRQPNEEGRPVRLTALAAVGWAIIPAFAFMADDFYLAAKAWNLLNDYRNVPADRFEVKMESAMWSWTYTYPNGTQAVNELRVPAGKPVVLRMTSKDVVHSHFIPDFRVKEDSMPGRVTYLMFYPKKPGEHIATCAEFCGMMHSKMFGKIIVMSPQEFQAWYDGETKKLAQEKSRQKGV
jgi:cytochrome c oxidase subunit 2